MQKLATSLLCAAVASAVKVGWDGQTWLSPLPWVNGTEKWSAPPVHNLLRQDDYGENGYNFDEELKAHKFVLVAFVNKQCGINKAFRPLFQKAGEILKEEGVDA